MGVGVCEWAWVCVNGCMWVCACVCECAHLYICVCATDISIHLLHVRFSNLPIEVHRHSACTVGAILHSIYAFFSET